MLELSLIFFLNARAEVAMLCAFPSYNGHVVESQVECFNDPTVNALRQTELLINDSDGIIELYDQDFNPVGTMPVPSSLYRTYHLIQS